MDMEIATSIVKTVGEWMVIIYGAGCLTLLATGFTVVTIKRIRGIED